MPQQKLSLNDLVVPPDFPATSFEKIHARLVKKVDLQSVSYREYSGAWNAVSYRFLAATQYSDDFTDSIKSFGSSPSGAERYRQERGLFGFFTNGLSTIEAAFYGLFAIGGCLNQTSFPLETPKDQKLVNPEQTQKAFKKAFPSEPILTSLNQTLSDPSFIQLKDIRNILAHRTAPGRTFFVSLDESEALPAEWKLMGISMDEGLTVTRRQDLARLLTILLVAMQAFVEVKFP